MWMRKGNTKYVEPAVIVVSSGMVAGVELVWLGVFDAHFQTPWLLGVGRKEVAQISRK